MADKIQHSTDAMPTDLKFSNFSEEHQIGHGGYGIVYKGVLENGKKIAVKKLHDIPYWLFSFRV
uniref:Protein kinase domain-containing protein n=1 Tax=Oryza meridionalis TaxID=40149 RepID=A0A0E0DXK5_9ORYZ